eukprot:COSAG02_NODE_72215_length_187_cov_28.613636_1_plen_49_part_01
MKPNKRTVRVVYMKTIQVCNVGVRGITNLHFCPLDKKLAVIFPWLDSWH